MRLNLTHWAMSVSAAALVCGNAEPAFAQAEGEEEIVVTATRRESRLQEVPVAVTAVSGDQLAQSGVADTERLAQVVPSLYITSAQQVGLGAQIRMRGVGTATGNPALEGSVGYFVDGVYLNRSNTAFNDLLDIERIEVLRGPQGTLFGKNTSAGVISVLSREPEFAFGGDARLAYTELGGIRVSGRVTGPLIEDRLAFSFSALGNVRDGYMNDVVSGADYNDRDRWVARGQLLFEPSDNFSLRFIVDDSARHENSTVPSFVQVDPVQRTLIESIGGTIPTPPGGNDHFDVAVNGPFTGETRDTGYTMIGNWDAPIGNLRVILAHRDSESEKDWDSDLTNVDVYRQTDDLGDEVTSAELQYTRTFGNVEALFGLYAFNTDTTYRKSQLLGADAGTYFDAFFNTLTASVAARNLVTPALWQEGFGMTLQDTHLEGEGWSAFTHNIWHVTPRFDITLGLRYQSEEKQGGSTFTYNQPAVCTAVFAGPGSVTANIIVPLLRPSSFCASATPNYSAEYDDDQLTGTLIASYNVTEDIMAYASYATGFKAGGVNLDSRAGASATQTFLPEAVESYELGLKSGSLGDGAVLNLAAFYMTFEDFQLNSFTPTSSFVLTNEGTVVSYGVELEGALRLADGLWLRGGVMWNEAQYGEDTLNPGLASFTISNAPEWSGTLGISYERPVENGWSMFGRLDGRAQSAVRTASNLDIRSRQTGYGVLNTRFGVRHWENGSELAVFGTNITDVHYRTVAFVTPPTGYMSYFGEPRIWGVEFSQRW